MFTTSMLVSFPMGPSLAHWSADATLTALGVAAAIVVYGYRASGAERRAFA